MFNWSWKIRSQRGYLSPQGPNFDWAPTQCLSLDGTQLSFKLPRQRTALPVESITLKGSWKLSDLNDKLYEFNAVRWRSTTVLMRQWDFYGDWFTGKRGGVTMTAVVISSADPTAGLNYFNPRALEVSVAEYLTGRYASQFSADNSKQLWHAPVNWTVCNNFPCIAARFEAVDTVVKHHGPHCYLVMPLTKTHYLLVECEINRPVVFSDKKPKPTIDEWIDLKPFLTLANQVLDSVQVILSSQAQADQEEALRGLDEKSLVKEYPPIKWTAPPVIDDENWRNQ